MSGDVIVFGDVSRWYGEVMALNGASFTIQPGVTGLLGPNGAGKTTLLRLVTGQLRPSLGQVRVFGVDPFRSPEVFRRVGYCPDEENLYESMTGFAFLEFAARLAGYGGAEASSRASRALERMALEKEGARRIGGYSKGMRQRLKLAQAFIHEPELLVLDEPLSGMDPVGRHLAIELVRSWGERGGSVLVSSHILHEVQAMTSRILLLQNARIRAEGDVREIRAAISGRPHHVLVRCQQPRRLAAELIDWDCVDGVAIDPRDDSLLVETRRAEEFHLRLPAHCLEQDHTITELSETDAGIDAVFDYLTGEQV